MEKHELDVLDYGGNGYITVLDIYKFMYDKDKNNKQFLRWQIL
jgi:hypothetical protein